MAQITETLACEIANGGGYTENEVRQLATLFLSLRAKLAEAEKDAKRWKKLIILGRVDSHGNVIWFADNPHAFPPCTEFYAMKEQP